MRNIPTGFVESQQAEKPWIEQTGFHKVFEFMMAYEHQVSGDDHSWFGPCRPISAIIWEATIGHRRTSVT